MRMDGVATVARQEFRLRIRAGRWKFLLLAWFGLLAVFTVLARMAAGTVEDLSDKGTSIYGSLALLVLGLALLVVPSLAAQSVNGDRERGTLAALQVTRLSPADITMGKFAAAWGTALVFLALTLPLALYAVTQGGVPIGRLVVVTVVLALLLGAVCAISLWLSSAVSRTTTSGLLAYLVVAVLTIGTLVAFGLATAVTQEKYFVTYPNVACNDERSQREYERTYQGPGSPLPPGCVETQEAYETARTRPDRVWWLLAPNPFVVLADAAPALPRVPVDLPEPERERAERARQLDPLGQIGLAARDLRREPVPLDVLSEQQSSGYGEVYEEMPDRPTRSVWPYGLAFDVALAGGALFLTTRRLKTPTRTLPRGQRVA